MIELAIILPVLLLLAVSVFDYGYYLEHVNNISTVVRDGTRYASLNTTGSPWSSSCPDPTYVQSGTYAGEYGCPYTAVGSNNIEALIQYEAESLTVPEGGLPLDNVDCVWSGNNDNPNMTAGVSTISIPASYPSGSGDSGAPGSCITVAYYTSSNGTYAPSSMSLYGWWSSDAASDAGCFELASSTSSSACTSTPSPPVGSVAQVTILYNFTATAPGPVFDVMGSALGLQATVVGQYSLVVIK
jgi:hypothetical protein